jgi:hypothetical protein
MMCSRSFASTLENWQSEFLQLVWQASGLALLYFWGSSQSKESDDRLEANIDRLLTEHHIDPAEMIARCQRGDLRLSAAAFGGFACWKPRHERPSLC